MNFIINTIEGAIHQLRVQVTNEVSLSEFTVYGSAACGCSTYPFEIVEKNDKDCIIHIPALNSGIYKYQLFVKQIVSNKEFLVLEGKIIVEDRVGNSSTCALGNTTIADIAIDGDTVEVSVSIEKGAKGDKGDKGDAGVVDYSVLEPYATRDYVDAQMATVENTVQQVIENTKSDGYLTREDKMKMVQEYYGIDLSRYDNWVIYNDEGGIEVIEGEDIYMTNGANSTVEKWDAKGREIYIDGFYGKEITNFTLQSSGYSGYFEQSDATGSSGKGYYLIQFSMNNCPNLVKFRENGTESDNVIDCRYDLENETTYKDGVMGNFQGNDKLENIKIISNGDELVWCDFSGCKNLKTIDCNCSLKIGTSSYNGSPFRDCESLIEVPNFNFDNLTKGDYWFENCKSLQSFDKPLPNLVRGYAMFRDCKSLKTFTVEMPKLINMEEMFRNSGLTSWSSKIPEKVNSLWGTFCESDLESFTADLNNVTSLYTTFKDCKNLKTFDCDLSKVTKAVYAFSNTNLTSFNCELPELTSADSMFLGSKIENFDKELPKVTSLNGMFNGCKSLKNVTLKLPAFTTSLQQYVFSDAVVENCIIEIPNATNAVQYFFGNNCMIENCNYTYGGTSNHDKKLASNYSKITNMVANYPNVTGKLDNLLSDFMITNLEFNAPLVTSCRYLCHNNKTLTTFNGNLSSLRDGYYAFNNTNLTSFNCELPELTEGSMLFCKCKLDADSVERILTSIPGRTNSPSLGIGIKRSAVAKLQEITGGHNNPNSYTTKYVTYKGWWLYVKVEEEDL